MKAWFLHPYDEKVGYVLHSETKGKAKAIGLRYDPFDSLDWTSLYVERCPTMDDKPITIETMIDAGFDMTFEGEPIDRLDIPCPCDLCKQHRKDIRGQPLYIACPECKGSGENLEDSSDCPECYGSGKVIRQY